MTDSPFYNARSRGVLISCKFDAQRQGITHSTTIRYMEDRREPVHSIRVRAGKRSYFFDVKTNRGDDYYLCITESIRMMDHNGRFVFDKHKIIIYKEDFDKFADGMYATLDFIRQQKGEDYGRDGFYGPPRTYPGPDDADQDTGPVTFDDLD